MQKDNSHRDKTATADELRDEIANAITEVLESAEIITEPEERVVLVNELIEKFVSPAMIRRAAGATSQVTVTMSPAGGVSSAHSSKASNVLLNLRSAATALPASLPALATFYKQQGISVDIGTAALAILYLFPLLKSMAELVKITLTQQAAGVLMVMWNTKKPEEETVGLDGLLERVNETFREYEWREINGEELASYIGTLEKINAIERANAFESIDINDIEWRLKENFEIAR
jgi:hypothetical protein